MAENKMPRPEYPRPQFVRKDWLNLNGEWEFETDCGCSGISRKLPLAEHLSGKILVPFCPESRLSGVGNVDFMPGVWYRRDFTVPQDWKGLRVLLHFGAVDYTAQVWVNGKSAGTHKGGYTPFSFDITGLLRDGANAVTVFAQDDCRTGLQPSGKQSPLYESFGCDYTRTTGIWQTVWLEGVPARRLTNAELTPDPDNGCLKIRCSFTPESAGCELAADASFAGRPEGSAKAFVTGDRAELTLRLDGLHLWEAGKPALYDLALTLRDPEGNTADAVASYFGMRSVTLENGAICINHRPVFQRLVLDQGFYPDGIYTAPTDGELKADIERSLAMGFNGARLHQKVFDPRYLYWADRLGYLVWGEYASWGLSITTAKGLEVFLPEWMESVKRDFSSPALVGWCPFNETWDQDGTKQDNEVLRTVYLVTKALDPTRPVIDTSGNFHVATDVFDIHDYDHDIAVFSAHYGAEHKGEPYNSFPDRQKYEGQPFFVSEYGGIGWDCSKDNGSAWGYGTLPKDAGEFVACYRGLTSALLGSPQVCAFCYTQLTDVEQEINGLYTYDRKPKFDPAIFREINSQKAAIEK